MNSYNHPYYSQPARRGSPLVWTLLMLAGTVALSLICAFLAEWLVLSPLGLTGADARAEATFAVPTAQAGFSGPPLLPTSLALGGSQSPRPPQIITPDRSRPTIPVTLNRPTSLPPFNTPDFRMGPTITPRPRSGDGDVYYPLEGCAASRLHKNDRIRVVPGVMRVSVRRNPDTHPSDNIIARFNEGQTAVVMDGPVCNYGWILWKIRVIDGVTGWAPESDGKEFWFEKLD